MRWSTPTRTSARPSAGCSKISASSEPATRTSSIFWSATGRCSMRSALPSNTLKWPARPSPGCPNPTTNGPCCGCRTSWSRGISSAAMPEKPVPIRVLVAKPGLDGHDRGAKVIARALRDAGMEVIYTGLRQTPEMIVNAALQEDVQVIGLSILSGAHNAIVPRIMDLLREKGMDDVLVLVGGIIPDEDAAELKKLGVAAVFQPGASLEAIVDFIRSSVKQTA